ncbi:hypothetical protein LCM19_07990 [Qipengyuania flava]|nr:hypothetical protein [Qipengyuania flava]
MAGLDGKMDQQFGSMIAKRQRLGACKLSQIVQDGPLCRLTEMWPEGGYPVPVVKRQKAEMTANAPNADVIRL